MAYGELKENLVKSISLNLPHMLKEVKHYIVEGIIALLRL
jgi:hypothetical protein